MPNTPISRGKKMKKATSKRERKYGKKPDETPKEDPKRKVKVMVDGYNILTFKNEIEAHEYINKKHEEAKSKHRPLTSFIIL